MAKAKKATKKKAAKKVELLLTKKEAKALIKEMNSVLGLDPEVNVKDLDLETMIAAIKEQAIDEDGEVRIYTTDDFTEEALELFEKLEIIPVDPPEDEDDEDDEDDDDDDDDDEDEDDEDDEDDDEDDDDDDDDDDDEDEDDEDDEDDDDEDEDDEDDDDEDDDDEDDDDDDDDEPEPFNVKKAKKPEILAEAKERGFKVTEKIRTQEIADIRSWFVKQEEKAATNAEKAAEKPAKKETKKAEKKTAKKEKKPGVIATIATIIQENGPITKEKILKKLAKVFPEREEKSLKGTINTQVPGKLRKEKGLNLVETKKGWIVEEPKKGKKGKKSKK